MQTTFEITFTYDENAKKWGVTAHGAASEDEAKQGFNAVLCTCEESFCTMEHKTEKLSDGVYAITPAVPGTIIKINMGQPVRVA